MALHRRAAKRDAAEPEIVKTLEAHGCIVWRLSGKGLTDLVVFYSRGRDLPYGVRRHTFIADVKSPKEKATPAQDEKWGALTALGFAVFILRTPNDAVAMLNNALQPWEPTPPTVTKRSTLRTHIKAASAACSCPPNWCMQDPPCEKAMGSIRAPRPHGDDKRPKAGDAARARAEGRKRLGMGHAIEPLTNDASSIKARANYTPPRSKSVDAAKEAAYDAATAELEAICKAAHMVAVVGQSEAHADRYEEWKAACEFLRSIAKEGP